MQQKNAGIAKEIVNQYKILHDSNESNNKIAPICITNVKTKRIKIRKQLLYNSNVTPAEKINNLIKLLGMKINSDNKIPNSIDVEIQECRNKELKPLDIKVSRWVEISEKH